MGNADKVRKVPGRGTRSDKLAALDRSVFGRRYGNGWLIGASIAGLAVLVLMGVGMAIGRNGLYALPELGVGLFTVPLIEIWIRRRVAQGRPSPLARLQRLDDRVLRRR